jgi:transcription-repair coupling factor (superfamily II helicase)
VRIKWIAIAMGLERILMKKGKLVGYFIADQQSGFYQTPEFTKVLEYAQSHSNIASMKEKQTRNGLRLVITFNHITSVGRALKALEHFTV